MILAEMKNKLSSKLNSEESKSIIEMVTGFDSMGQILNSKKEVSKEQEKEILEILHKRQNGYPLQYILGKWSFMGNDYFVGEGVLIPRDDTEVVVSSVIPYLRNIDSPKILDLCSGSGIIPITLKKMFPSSEVHALELSDKAIVYLEKNIKFHNCNIILHKGDLNLLYKDFEEGYFDLIISNPPYIKQEDMLTLQEEVKSEPTMALEGGVTGLDFYKAIVSKYSSKLKKGGMLSFELGENQFDDVKAMMTEKGFVNIKEFLDLGNIQRAINGTYLL